MEFSKLMLSFDPMNDPFGTLLKIDFYSLRSGEISFLTTFADKFSEEMYDDEKETILLLPNMAFSTAVAKFLARGSEETLTKDYLRGELMKVHKI